MYRDASEYVTTMILTLSSALPLEFLPLLLHSPTRPLIRMLSQILIHSRIPRISNQTSSSSLTTILHLPWPTTQTSDKPNDLSLPQKPPVTLTFPLTALALVAPLPTMSIMQLLEQHFTTPPPFLVRQLHPARLEETMQLPLVPRPSRNPMT